MWEGIPEKASWRRYQLSGALKVKNQKQVNRQRNSMARSQDTRESLKVLFYEIAEG